MIDFIGKSVTLASGHRIISFGSYETLKVVTSRAELVFVKF